MHKQNPKRIVLTTFGSLGDLHPYIALGIGLRERGHEVSLATSEIYRKKIEGEGLGFFPVRPDLLPPEQAKELIAKVMDERRGPAFLFKRILLPALRDSYEDLMAATEGADLLVGHMITLAAPLVAEKRGMRWVSTALQPSVFLSAYDPPNLATTPWPAWLMNLGPSWARGLLAIVRMVQNVWLRPVLRFRAELGLPATRAAGLDLQVSPYLHLALFSSALAKPQIDWPRQTRQCGFCFFDRLDAEQHLSPEIETFLLAGPPPIIFTLGSSAVMNPGSFYRESIAAARILSARALLLIGPDAQGLPKPLPQGMLAAPYAPYSEVFPRGAVIVHQGGVGTTGQALRAGRPQLIVPFAYDQPDNAARVARQGAGRVLARRRYTSERVATELRSLLSESTYTERAKKLADIVHWEDGVATACDAIEQQLALAG
jgi:UDP:flavonoid glycosyltransferase YjiC (YdhE family)